MAFSRVSLFYIFFLTTTLAFPSGSSRKGCGKSAIHSRSSVPKIRHGKVHLLASAEEYSTGIKKRSAEEDDCLEKKRENVVQTAATAFSGIHQENKKTVKKSELRTSDTKILTTENKYKSKTDRPVKKSLTGALALTHVVKDTNVRAHVIARKPNLRTLKNSPLWSLSKLIDDVSAISEEKKVQKKNGSLDQNEKELKKENNRSTESSRKHNFTVKATVAENDGAKSDGLKVALGKVIDKVERIVANKNSGLIGQKKTRELDKKPSNQTKKPENEKGKSVTETENSKKNNSTVSSKANALTEPKAPADPYAEIAAGPDRPKLPELKSDESVPNDGPLMKMGGSGSVQSFNSGTDGGKNEKPLSGQHDVGGLLDSLTDKLNAAGGGVATEQPLGGNDVKYLQSQLGLDDDQPEKQGSETMPPGLDKLTNGMDKLKEESELSEDHKGSTMTGSSSAEKLPETSPVDSLDKDVMDKLETSEESLGKLSEKSNGMNKFSAMDLLKSTKSGNEELSEYAGADISPGPDPYAIPSPDGNGEGNLGSFNQQSAGTEYGSQGVGEMATSDLLNSGGMTNMPEQEGLDRGVQESYAQPETTGGYEQAGESEGAHDFELNDELTGNTRSRTKDDSYLNAAMSAMNGENSEGGFNTRQNIPESIWNGARGIDNQETTNQENSFNDNYNTQMFKKNVILRPKRDTYVSPFVGKESFEIDM